MKMGRIETILFVWLCKNVQDKCTKQRKKSGKEIMSYVIHQHINTKSKHLWSSCWKKSISKVEEFLKSFDKKSFIVFVKFIIVLLMWINFNPDAIYIFLLALLPREGAERESRSRPIRTRLERMDGQTDLQSNL